MEFTFAGDYVTMPEINMYPFVGASCPYELTSMYNGNSMHLKDVMFDTEQKVSCMLNTIATELQITYTNAYIEGLSEAEAGQRVMNDHRFKRDVNRLRHYLSKHRRCVNKLTKTTGLKFHPNNMSHDVAIAREYINTLKEHGLI